MRPKDDQGGKVDRHGLVRGHEEGKTRRGGMKPLSGVFGRCAGVNDVRERGFILRCVFARVRDRKWA